MKSLKILVIALLIIVLILFVVQNLKAVTSGERLRLDHIFSSFKTPEVFLPLTICFAAGYGLAWVLGFVDRQRLKKNMKELYQRQARTEEELNSLRNLPITSDAPYAPDTGR